MGLFVVAPRKSDNPERSEIGRLRSIELHIVTVVMILYSRDESLIDFHNENRLKSTYKQSQLYSCCQISILSNLHRMKPKITSHFVDQAASPALIVLSNGNYYSHAFLRVDVDD